MVSYMVSYSDITVLINKVLILIVMDNGLLRVISVSKSEISRS